MNENLAKAQDVFLNEINQICGKFGLNNIMAQLYAILYLSDKPLSLDDMVDRLKISKGSASINIRALERYGAVRRVWVKGSRKDFYEAETDIVKVVMDRVQSMVHGRLTELEHMINSSYAALNSMKTENADEEKSVEVFKERMGKVRDVYDQASSMFLLFEQAISSKVSV